MHKIFSFKGITRGGDNLLADEGSCIEVMNLRMKNGAFVPFPSPQEQVMLEYRYSRIFWHEMTRHYLCLTDDSEATLHVYDNEWNRVKDVKGKPLLFKALQGVRNVEFHGYVACCMTDNGIAYLLYNDGSYLFLGERPPMPELRISTVQKLSRRITESSFQVSSSNEFQSTWRYNAKGFFDEAIHELNVAGYYIDRAFFKFALRSYDGSYIAISPAIYVSDEDTTNGVGRDCYNLVATPVNNSDSSTYDVKVVGFKPEFTFNNLALDDWKNVVVGIDVFTTGSIMGKKVDDVKWRKHALGLAGCEFVEYEEYVDKDFEELCKEIVDAAHYYRIAEYDIEGNLIDSQENVSQTNLVLQQALENDVCSFVSIVPECTYMFNNRLHIGCLKEYFCKGYDAMFLIGTNDGRKVVPLISVTVRINTAAGVSAVVRNYEYVSLKHNGSCLELPPLLSYPDVRAFEMSICVNTGTEFLYKTFRLTPHRFLNQSQYLNKWTLGFRVTSRASLSGTAFLSSLRDEDVVAMFSRVAGTHKLVYSAEQSAWLYNGNVFRGDDIVGVRLVGNGSSLAEGDSIVFTITACDDDLSYRDVRNIAIDSSWTVMESAPVMDEVTPYELRLNVLKVSAVDNPFSFPLKCTYTPSQGNIVALASNTVALSQGQFGQHPLYVFCSDGIWAMAVDGSGSVAYHVSYPLSREVCTNRNSLCGIDAGVVFVGRQGVMLLSGGKIKKLSAMIDGNPELSRRILDNDIITKISSAMLPTGVVAADDFNDYMDGAVVSYLPSQNEVIFANEKYAYSYIYSLQYDIWGHISVRVKDFVKRYSSVLYLVQEKGRSYVMDIGDSDSGDNNVMLVSRPQLWGTGLPKRVLQLMLHAYSKPSSGTDFWNPSLACYMLGSNDGVNFKLIAGRETVKERNGLKFPYFPTQGYSSFIFVVCGKMSGVSWITGIDVNVEQAWNNRIR